MLLNPVGNMSMYRSSSLSGFNRDCRGNQQSTSMPYSKGTLDMCSFLFRRGWISGYTVSGNVNSVRKTIVVQYRYYANQNVLYRLRIKSTPGRRIFWTYRKLLSMCRSSGFHCHYVLSTSRGLLSSEEALSRKIGGELLVQILF